MDYVSRETSRDTMNFSLSCGSIQLFLSFGNGRFTTFSFGINCFDG